MTPDYLTVFGPRYCVLAEEKYNSKKLLSPIMTCEHKPSPSTTHIVLATLSIAQCLLFFALLQSVMPESSNIWHQIRYTKNSLYQRYREIAHSNDCWLWALLILLKVAYSAENILDASLNFLTVLHFIHDGVLWIHMIQVSEYYADTQVTQSSQTLLINEPNAQLTHNTLLTFMVALTCSLSAHHFTNDSVLTTLLPFGQIAIAQYLLLQQPGISHPLRDRFAHSKARIQLPKLYTNLHPSRYLTALKLRELVQKITPAPQRQYWLKQLLKTCCLTPSIHPIDLVKQYAHPFLVANSLAKPKSLTNTTADISLQHPESTLDEPFSLDAEIYQAHTHPVFTNITATAYHFFHASTGIMCREQLAVSINNLCHENAFVDLVANHHQSQPNIAHAPRLSPRSPRTPPLRKSASETNLRQRHQTNINGISSDAPLSAASTISWQVEMYQLSFRLIDTYPYQFNDNWVCVACNLLLSIALALSIPCQIVSADMLALLQQKLLQAPIVNPQMLILTRFSIASALLTIKKHSEARHYFFQTQLALQQSDLPLAHVDQTTADAISEITASKSLKT